MSRHDAFRKIKAAGGRQSALNQSWFRRPVHPASPDFEDGECNNLGEMAAEFGVLRTYVKQGPNLGPLPPHELIN